MNYEKIEAYAEAFAAAPRLAELEIRTGAGGVLRLRRSLDSAEKKLRAAKKPTATTPVAAAPLTASGTTPSTGTIVTSTLVGVFRAATKVPVSVGDMVNPSQVLGIVEAMRIPNEVVAPVEGVLSAIYVQDGQPVEYGQPLFEIGGDPIDQE